MQAMEDFREMQRRHMERTVSLSYNSINSVPQQWIRERQELSEDLLEGRTSILMGGTPQHLRDGPEDWENDLPTIEEMHIDVINWLRPMEFDDRIDALLELDGSLRSWEKQIKQRRMELRTAFQSSEVFEARTVLRQLFSRLELVWGRIAKHLQLHQVLQALYNGPTRACEQIRFAIEEYESRLQLPIRSCFMGNYRLGFGKLQDYLARDTGLRERAYREELRSTSIANLPAWELPNLNPNSENTFHDPPMAWRSTLRITATTFRRISRRPHPSHTAPPYDVYRSGDGTMSAAAGFETSGNSSEEDEDDFIDEGLGSLSGQDYSNPAAFEADENTRRVQAATNSILDGTFYTSMPEQIEQLEVLGGQDLLTFEPSPSVEVREVEDSGIEDDDDEDENMTALIVA